MAQVLDTQGTEILTGEIQLRRLHVQQFTHAAVAVECADVTNLLFNMITTHGNYYPVISITLPVRSDNSSDELSALSVLSISSVLSGAAATSRWVT